MRDVDAYPRADWVALAVRDSPAYRDADSSRHAADHAYRDAHAERTWRRYCDLAPEADHARTAPGFLAALRGTGSGRHLDP